MFTVKTSKNEELNSRSAPPSA